MTNVFLPFAAIKPARFRITNVLPSPEIEDEMAITFASFFTKLMFDRIERIASAIRDLDDSLTMTSEYFIFFFDKGTAPSKLIPDGRIFSRSCILIISL